MPIPNTSLLPSKRIGPETHDVCLRQVTIRIVPLLFLPDSQTTNEALPTLTECSLRRLSPFPRLQLIVMSELNTYLRISARGLISPFFIVCEMDDVHLSCKDVCALEFFFFVVNSITVDTDSRVRLPQTA